ncbi:hypothetical protein ACJJTC_009223 [Scirpophaga incertulas]
MSDLHLSYRLGLSTIKYIIEEVCSLIWEILKNECLPEPNPIFWNKIALGFERDANFRNCVGALDGKHARITCPKERACGSEADANVFKKSSLFHRLERDDLNLPPPKLLPGTSINPQPHVYVADAAFGISNTILRPYARTNLTHKKKIFNYSTRSGNTIRDNFANYFVSNEGSVPWQKNYIY